jgi:hypothetical protein
MFPSAPYNAKPAPIHAGDFDAIDFSTVLLTSSGYAMLAGGSGQTAAAAKPAAPFSSGGLASQLAGLAVVGALLLYLDKRIAR